MAQPARRTAPESAPPPGLRYVPEFLTADEEAELVARVEELAFREVRMFGTPARRTTAHFGWNYDYDARKLDRPVPIPEFLLPLRERAAGLIGVQAEALAEVLVTRYPPGATIGWHRDAPMFGPAVVGVSLLSGCEMRFRKRAGTGFERYTQVMEPGSAYVLGGPARSVWQHSIPPVAALRYSITFRTLRLENSPHPNPLPSGERE
jgi:DNA oxidative demethylase